MIQMNARLRADMVFASILWLTVIGMGLWGLVGLLENKVLYWKKEG
jgi:putative hydroxymethylpyrimidine transport system permease protein